MLLILLRRFDFTDAGAEGLYVPWSQLKPTYRGKPKTDAGDLNTKNVRRFSIMSRRYVLQLVRSICAY
jgi:hypothetical protein